MYNGRFVTEHLAMGLLDTDKDLVFAVLNTANYDVMGYVFIAGNTPKCLEDVGCWEEDIQKADEMGVGEMIYGDWTAEKAIIIIKMKDTRKR